MMGGFVQKDPQENQGKLTFTSNVHSTVSKRLQVGLYMYCLQRITVKI